MDFYALSILLGISLLSFTTPATTLSPTLILTPYIEQNRTQEARKLSKVDPKIFFNITSHSGFLNVDKNYNSSTFFWYFPVDGKAVNDTPWIIWLQGGPGASSLIGLFDEIGPFQYDAESSGLKPREWSWCKDYSMVFIDNPIGSGFSFTDNEAGYAHNMTEYANHLYKAVKQVVLIFPELGTAPLYIAGESYAGKFVPALAEKIMRNQSGSVPVNLEGIILGNPLVNPVDQSNYTELYYQWGLVDLQGILATKDLQDNYTRSLNGGDAAKAFELRNKLLEKLTLISAQTQTYNIIDDSYELLEDFTMYLRKEEVQEALHVGNTKFEYRNDKVVQKLVPDFLSSASEKIEALLEHCRVLIYCGQLDLTAGCANRAAARRGWRWSRQKEFLNAPRTPWADANDALTGYVKSGGGLTEVLIKAAGHLAPRDKPKETAQLISYFIRGLDLPSPPNYQILPENTPPLIKPNNSTSNSKVTQTDEINKNTPFQINSTSSSKATQTDENNKNTPFQMNSGVGVSIILNVILVVTVVVGVIFYVKMKRKYEAFYYSNVDNLSDDIFLS